MKKNYDLLELMHKLQAISDNIVLTKVMAKFSETEVINKSDRAPSLSSQTIGVDQRKK